jgi:glycerophosphoryl diester phosphodiesterase
VLEGSVAVIECDIASLGDGTLVLMHDDTLERETTGVGRVADLGLRAFKALRLRGSEEPPATLAEVVDAAALPRRTPQGADRREGGAAAHRGGGSAPAARARAVARAAPSALVFGCLGDWNLRTLRRLDPEVELGFDPAFHLHAPGPGQSRSWRCRCV